MKPLNKTLCAGAAGITIAMASLSAQASSHMDAPLITLDPAANTTDVYVFRSAQNGTQYLTTAVSVYPFEEPGIGPNNYRFDDDVRYEIHLVLDNDVPKGRKTISYQFRFDTQFKNRNTILQSYLGVLDGTIIDDDGFDTNQNMRQTYTVKKVDFREHWKGRSRVLGGGRVPPNNQGLVTPFYNQDDFGEQPAKEGVNSPDQLDSYTKNAIFVLKDGTQVFAGQREDGFYADIQSLFDLDFGFGGPNKPFDSQAGYNVHTIALNIPLSTLAPKSKIVGVYATTSRKQINILSSRFKRYPDIQVGRFVQVGRQGNPLFNEGFVAIEDKDRYNRSEPTVDKKLFKKYALNPELATAIGLPDEDRQDIAGIFIPDIIKVDISTGPVPQPNQSNFHRLSIFGGDTVKNAYGDDVPGGFPNGRRFGDDVLDIAVIALAPEILAGPLTSIDKVDENDITYNGVFPYAGTPLNGRNHAHD